MTSHRAHTRIVVVVLALLAALGIYLSAQIPEPPAPSYHAAPSAPYRAP